MELSSRARYRLTQKRQQQQNRRASLLERSGQEVTPTQPQKQLYPFQY